MASILSRPQLLCLWGHDKVLTPVKGLDIQWSLEKAVQAAAGILQKYVSMLLGYIIK